jgi:(2R)-3-sulfolactate dehydrogenase (NADP+)
LSADAFDARMAVLLEALAAEPGARLPGMRRLTNRARAATEGVAIPPALLAEIRALNERPA